MKNTTNFGLMVILLIGTFLSANFIKIDKLVVKSIHIDSAKGFSFKNMMIVFDKRKDANNILKEAFSHPKYSFTECHSGTDTQGCIVIKDSNYESIESKNSHIKRK